MIGKVFKASSAALVALFGLTACTPPMPPELLASLAEQSYTCVEGDSNLYLQPEIADLGEGFAVSMSEACPGMNLILVESADEADLIVGAGSYSTCVPFASAPFAVDAAVIVFNIPDAYSLNLSPEVFVRIISGELTSWDDPSISELNPDFELPDLPVKIVDGPSQDSNDSLKDWFSRESGEEIGSVTANDDFKLEDISEGSISVVPYSFAFVNSLTSATVVLGEDIYVDVALPDAGGILAAASQFKPTLSGNALGLLFDETKKAVAPEGFDVAANSYQAVFGVPIQLCGEDTLHKRAAAKFLLRQDQQGSVSASSMLPIPEFVRAEALTVVSKGLPEPELPQELLDEIAQ